MIQHCIALNKFHKWGWTKTDLENKGADISEPSFVMSLSKKQSCLTLTPLIYACQFRWRFFFLQLLFFIPLFWAMLKAFIDFIVENFIHALSTLEVKLVLFNS